MDSPRNTLVRSIASPTCLVAALFVLPALAQSSRLVVPPVRLSSVANRAFQVVGPRTWNDLPVDVTSAELLSTFRQRLKTHLFSKSFPGYFLDIN